MKEYKELETVFAKINDLHSVVELLNWDSATIMPTNSYNIRSEHISTLTSLAHTIICDPHLGEALDNVQSKTQNLDEWQIANLKKMQHDFNHANALDSRLVKALSEAGQKCENIWRTAKKENNFKKLSPYLKEIFKLVREKSQAKAAFLNCDPYQALLDEYDAGRNDLEVDKIFQTLENFLPSFIEKVQEKQNNEWVLPEIKGRFLTHQQKSLGMDIMQDMGFDFNRGRLDESIHPFCSGTMDDTRMTTHYDNKDFSKSLMGIIHETGHGLYQQGLPKQYHNQPVGQACGLNIHESQSLLWEMQIARSQSFMTYLEQKLKKYFRIEQELSPDNLFKFYNHVEPSLIRIDADEVTYPMHVILRYRIEKYIINGDLEVDDLPDAWNQGMEKYLNITPKKFSEGCMQDIHWMDGTFGYFPVYLLGAISAAQFMNSLRQNFNNLDQLVSKGEFQPILSWLRTNIHNKGSLYNSDELLTNVTGNKLDATLYMNYLNNKFL